VGVQIATTDDVRAIVREELERVLARIAPDPLVSIEEAARVLGVSVSTVRRGVKDREIPARKVGGQWRIERGDLSTRDADVVDLAARARAR
jgi:excisionase family DNA binding protein